MGPRRQRPSLSRLVANRDPSSPAVTSSEEDRRALGAPAPRQEAHRAIDLGGLENRESGDETQAIFSHNGMDANTMKNARILKEPSLASVLTRRALTAVALNGNASLVTALCSEHDSIAAMREIAR
jgi:hypothetical protein